MLKGYCKNWKKVGDGLLSSGQQISFGRKQEKPQALRGGQGHSKFLHAGSASERVVRQKDCSPRFFLVCAAKATCGKEAYLVT
jgi:hypothetical protein